MVFNQQQGEFTNLFANDSTKKTGLIVKKSANERQVKVKVDPVLPSINKLEKVHAKLQDCPEGMYLNSATILKG